MTITSLVEKELIATTFILIIGAICLFAVGFVIVNLIAKTKDKIGL